MAGPADFGTIVTAILNRQGTIKDNTVIVAMLVGAGLESGWNINQPGGGAFQIIDAARPHATVVKSQIQADVDYMLPRYIAASIVHAAQPNTADKYADIAHDAERPAERYQNSQGEAKVQAVYQTVTQNYGTGDAGSTVQGVVKTVSPVGDLLGEAGAVLKWLATPANWVRIAEVGLGATIVIVALHAMATSGSAAKSASTLKGHVVKAAKLAVFV
jgi:hypothetical protein